MRLSFLKCSFILALPGIGTASYGQNTIFIEGKTLTYAVEYAAENIHVKDTITLTPTGKPWHIDPEKQKENVIAYPSAGLLDTSVFADLPSIGWVKADTTGFVENTEMCWIHPPRHNQYRILELAPFPRVEYPLVAGRTYARKLYIGDGWGELSHTVVTWHYKIVGKVDGSWLISSRATPEHAPDEVNTLDFEFHPTAGFDKLEYKFSRGVAISMVQIGG